MVDEGQVLVYWREDLVRAAVLGVVCVCLVCVVVSVAGVEVMSNAHHVPLVTVKAIVTERIDDAAVPKVKAIAVCAAKGPATVTPRTLMVVIRAVMVVPMPSVVVRGIILVLRPTVMAV